MFDRAYTSSLRRAQETLSLVLLGANQPDVPRMISWRLNEVRARVRDTFNVYMYSAALQCPLMPISCSCACTLLRPRRRCVSPGSSPRSGTMGRCRGVRSSNASKSSERIRSRSGATPLTFRRRSSPTIPRPFRATTPRTRASITTCCPAASASRIRSRGARPFGRSAWSRSCGRGGPW